MELLALEEKKVEFVKLKEKNAKFCSKMRDEERVFHPTRSTKLTIPITPALHTSMRAHRRLNNKERNRKRARPCEREHLKSATSPSRAKSRPRTAPSQRGGGPSTHAMGKTIPQSFKLSKTKRRRACRDALLSTEQKQLKMMEERGQFHARKVNRNLFKAGAPIWVF